MATTKKSSSTAKKSTAKKSARGQTRSGKVAKVMHEFKEGELKSRGQRRVTNPKQAIAIALNEAREAGEKVPPPKRARAKKAATSKKRATVKRAPAKKAATKTKKKRS